MSDGFAQGGLAAFGGADALGCLVDGGLRRYLEVLAFEQLPDGARVLHRGEQLQGNRLVHANHGGSLAMYRARQLAPQII